MTSEPRPIGVLPPVKGVGGTPKEATIPAARPPRPAAPRRGVAEPGSRGVPTLAWIGGPSGAGPWT
jgi:hypothetical protein